MKTLFYAAWISAGRKDNPISWGKPCVSPSEAAAVLKERIAAGQTHLGVVVKVEGGQREALETYIWPPSARKVVRHYLDILDKIAEGKDEPR